MISLKSECEESSAYVVSVFAERGWNTLKDSAKPLRVILLTEPLAADICRIKSTKKCSEQLPQPRLSFTAAPSLSKRKNLLKKMDMLTQCSCPRGQRRVDVCDNKITTEKELYRQWHNKKSPEHCSGNKEKAETRCGSSRIMCQEGKRRVSPKYTQLSDKDVNTFVKNLLQFYISSFEEKVL